MARASPFFMRVFAAVQSQGGQRCHPDHHMSSFCAPTPELAEELQPNKLLHYQSCQSEGGEQVAACSEALGNPAAEGEQGARLEA